MNFDRLIRTLSQLGLKLTQQRDTFGEFDSVELREGSTERWKAQQVNAPYCSRYAKKQSSQNGFGATQRNSTATADTLVTLNLRTAASFVQLSSNGGNIGQQIEMQFPETDPKPPTPNTSWQK